MKIECNQVVFDSLASLCEFAYEQGFHELGYDPVEVVVDHIRALEALLGAQPERAKLCHDGHEPIVHFSTCPLCSESQRVEKWPTKPRDRYVTTDEYDRFRAICCPQVQIAMDLALLTGQRQGDLVGLTWKQIKAIGLPRDQWHIEIDQGKTGKKLAIMISPDVEAVLKRAKLMLPHWPREHVLRTKWGKAYTPDGFRAMWQRYCRLWEKAGNPRFHFHDLRAKSISDNESLDSAYLLAGHIDIKMTRKVYDRNRRKVQPLR